MKVVTLHRLDCDYLAQAFFAGKLTRNHWWKR